MDFNKFFYSFFSAVVAIFFILLGLICVMIPWVPTIRDQIIFFINENVVSLSLFGFVFILIGMAILANIMISGRQRYYVVRGGEKGVQVDVTVVQQHLDRYWTELFPDCDVPNSVTLKNNKIHITANFPSLPLGEQKPLLQRIEGELTESFKKVFGYENEFFISASFRESER